MFFQTNILCKNHFSKEFIRIVIHLTTITLSFIVYDLCGFKVGKKNKIQTFYIKNDCNINFLTVYMVMAIWGKRKKITFPPHSLFLFNFEKSTEILTIDSCISKIAINNFYYKYAVFYFLIKFVSAKKTIKKKLRYIL